MQAMITLRGVSKVYDGSSRPALDGVSLDIEAGRVTAIMGPSGCGKSTLLNLVGGLDRPTRGEIGLDGVRVDQLGESGAARFRRTKVGFVFQFFQLLDDLSVRDNVLVAAELAGAPRREARARAEELLGQLGLGDRLSRFPATLSGGERQRLAIARAVVNRPAVLLADEPTGALDTHNGESVLALLDDLNRHGQTILLVTHDERLASGRAHRILRLVDGSIVGDGAGTGRLMGAVRKKALAGLRRRRLQGAVIAVVCPGHGCGDHRARHPRRGTGALRACLRHGERSESRRRLPLRVPAAQLTATARRLRSQLPPVRGRSAALTSHGRPARSARGLGGGELSGRSDPRDRSTSPCPRAAGGAARRDRPLEDWDKLAGPALGGTIVLRETPVAGGTGGPASRPAATALVERTLTVVGIASSISTPDVFAWLSPDDLAR